MSELKNGVWPVMITPYNKDGSVDYGATRAIVEWYRTQGVQGIFSVCLSSEMFLLTLDERAKIARTVVEAAADDIEVVASGHVSYSAEDQLKELRTIADTGVKSVVMVSNRLARLEESDDVYIANAEKLIAGLEGVSFGLYECPHPYKRLLNERILRWMAETGHFTFIKDTCSRADMIADRIRILKENGGKVKLYNANVNTLLQSLRDGAAGFSGIMANFHADLYVWLCAHWQDEPEKAEKLQALLTVMSMYEGCNYPQDCKYHMNLVGVPMELYTRNAGAVALNAYEKDTVRQMLYVEEMARELCGISKK